MPSGDTALTITGNLTADPELRCASEIAVAAFTAASRRVYDQDCGQWAYGNTLFLRCRAWRHLAGLLTESVAKGMRVIVTGRLKQPDYEAADVQKRTVHEVDVEDAGPSLRYATATPHPAGASTDQRASAAPAPAVARDQPPF
jgi:single-strand DNA-binding protein